MVTDGESSAPSWDCLARKLRFPDFTFARAMVIAPCSDAMGELPRTLWTLWLQGWDVAPETAQACLASWRRLNPEWEVRALDRASLSSVIGTEALSRILRPKSDQAMSDEIRIELLHAHGGVWTDATAMCAQPLEQWLPARMATGFFAFDRPVSDRPLASWFLAAKRNSEIVSAWRQRVVEYWNAPHAEDYFWFHNLFAELCIQDKRVRTLWNTTPTLPAKHPFHFGPNSSDLFSPPTQAHIEALAHPPSPVFKLTHKLDQPWPRNALIETLHAFGRGERTQP